MQAYSEYLTSAGIGRHYCQVHQSTEALRQALTGYSLAGLRGGAVILLATQARLEQVAGDLLASGVDVSEYRKRRQLMLVDVAELLPRIMPGHKPLRDVFMDSMGEMLQDVEACNHGPIRVYGELVNELWQQGETDAAIALEYWWNELADRYRFTLYCGYHVDGLDPRSYRTELAEIAALHTGLIESPDDLRLQEAVDAACNDVLGLPMSTVLCYRDKRQHDGEYRLPAGCRTIFWLKRNMPASVNKILARARMHYRQMVETPSTTDKACDRTSTLS